MKNLFPPTFLLVLGFGTLASSGRAESDPRAVAVAERMMAAMGGRETFENARLLRFDFAPERDGKTISTYHHWWDRHTGRYRLEGKTREGEPFRALFDVNTKEGQVWTGRNRLEGEEETKFLEWAYGRFINDTYWIMMPWKWLDPGVNLAYEGEKEIDGTVYEVVKLTFDAGVGLTSADQYWGYVSKESNLMERWAYVLQDDEGNTGTGEPSVWIWNDWKETSVGVKLSTLKRKVAGDSEVAIRFAVAEMAADAPEERLNPILRPHSPVAPPEAATGTPPSEAGLENILVVLNKSDHTAALVDPGTLETVRLIPTGIGPHEAIASRDGRRLYVADYGTATPGNTLTVIDVPSGEVVDKIDLGEHRRPHGIVTGPDGSIWVTTEDSRSVLEISADDHSIQRVFETDEDITHMLVLTADGKRAFTANIGSGTVSVIDTESGKVETVTTGRGAEGIDITPDGKEVWVAHRQDDNVVVLDAETLKSLATVDTGRFPIRVKVTPDGTRVLVTCAMSNEMVVFDRVKREEIGRVQLDAVPIGIQITPDGRRAFVANTQADKVTVVDLENLEIAGSFSPGNEPDGMAWISRK